ncbi:ABC transporter permease [Camelimonas fluminis]|uniref:ABC transporter permease n=1 Tax=Camelimonas fluminis TaxID=1576911 RepID=A0ABV7UKX2_9HYPH|nr:ABC transporter permease subunit [Camelimonas fluminis]GHE59396.1 ABC transporter permease [Camelimonas fluminis]
MNGRTSRFSPALPLLTPLLTGLAALALWELAVRWGAIPPYILPGPVQVLQTLWSDRAILLPALGVTLWTTLEALALAVAGGASLALLFSRSRLLSAALYPFAVVLQVTPVIAIAPLLLVWLEPGSAVLVCAFLVAFFPVLSNTAAGLQAIDPGLDELFRLYGASRWQRLVRLEAPTAAPHFLAGLRIAGGLALIGAIVAEIAAGAAGQGSGLAWRIVEAGYRLNIPRMFAALLLISVSGVLIHAGLSLLTRLLPGQRVAARQM